MKKFINLKSIFTNIHRKQTSSKLLTSNPHANKNVVEYRRKLLEELEKAEELEKTGENELK